jgi:hypothetical protein
MPRRENGEQHYEVHLSAAIAKRIWQIARQAAREGRGEIALSSFRQIGRRLQMDPLKFGDPLYHLPALGLQVRQGFIYPLFVSFAVREDPALVFIKGVELLPERPS